MLLPVMRNSDDWMPTMFDDMMNDNWMQRMNATAPAINVLENDKAYDVEVAAPGMTKDDFNISVDKDNNLTIKMEKKDEHKDEDKKAHYLRREFSYSKYCQTLQLPDNCEKDKISAKVENGVVRIEIPKCNCKEEKECRKISIE